MKRLIISVFILAMLVLPASAAASRSYSGSGLGIVLKANKNQIKQLGLGRIPLQCDEGTTNTAEAATLVWRFDPAKQIKKNRKFHVVADKTLSYATIDPITGDLGTVERDRFELDVEGRFNKRYSKASGTLRFTGSFRGPDPNATIEGQLSQYHNCDSGTIQWEAHKFEY